VNSTVEERIALPVGVVELRRPSEARLSEEDFHNEEFIPYWAELWDAAVALAHEVSLRTLRGAPVLELGCGLGLPSIAAALAGGRVLATDWSVEAMKATRANARRNNAEVETAVVDWGKPELLVERGPWAMILASDVLYERRNVDALLEVLPKLVDHRSEVLIADPGRAFTQGFFERAEASWHHTDTASTRSERVRIHRLRLPDADHPPGRAASEP
jgi:predicted nicotinamide N-methyase